MSLKGFPDSNRGVLKNLKGGDNNGGLTVLDKSSNEGPIGGPAGSVEKEGSVSRPSRLQDTLHRYEESPFTPLTLFFCVCVCFLIPLCFYYLGTFSFFFVVFDACNKSRS